MNEGLFLELKSLYLASSQILFPYEVSFSNFLNIILDASLKGSFRDMPVIPFEESGRTIFYPLRISSSIVEEVRKRAPQMPVDFNTWIRRELRRCTREEGVSEVLVIAGSLGDFLQMRDEKKGRVRYPYTGFSPTEFPAAEDTHRMVGREHRDHLQRVAKLREVLQ